MNYSVSSFTPPKGTTVTRPMTYAERKSEGRKGYARHILRELLMLHEWADVNGLRTKAFGTRVTLTFNGNQATLTFNGGNWSPAPIICCPLYDTNDGRYNLELWLTSHDPCVGARLLKNARKQIRDRKSVEGQKKKQTYTEPHSTMDINEFELPI